MIRISLILTLILICYSISIIIPVHGKEGVFINGPHTGIENRHVVISTNLIPDANSGNQTYSLYLRIYDSTTNETIQHVSMVINITKNNKILLNDTFHTHTGFLDLKIVPNDLPEGKWIVQQAGADPILKGWTPRINDKPIVLKAPIFLDDSFYNLHITMLTIDYDSNFFYVNTRPNFDTVISLQNENSPKIMAPHEINSTFPTVGQYGVLLSSFSQPELKSPFDQFESGIALKDITCKNGYQIVIKVEGHSPACVKPDVVHVLVDRGWAIDPQSLEAKLLLANECLGPNNACERRSSSN